MKDDYSEAHNYLGTFYMAEKIGASSAHFEKAVFTIRQQFLSITRAGSTTPKKIIQKQWIAIAARCKGN